jgi:hypothetical protein
VEEVGRGSFFGAIDDIGGRLPPFRSAVGTQSVFEAQLARDLGAPGFAAKRSAARDAAANRFQPGFVLRLVDVFTPQPADVARSGRNRAT